jgi:hypothetical protein
MLFQLSKNSKSQRKIDYQFQIITTILLCQG